MVPASVDCTEIGRRRWAIVHTAHEVERPEVFQSVVGALGFGERTELWRVRVRNIANINVSTVLDAALTFR